MGFTNLSGFNFISKTRKKKTGGGLFKAKQIDSPFIEGIFETIAIDITIKEQTFRVVNIYKPPNTKKTDLLECINSIPTDGIPANNLLVMGDLNVDLLNESNGDLIIKFAEKGLYPLINNPTRIHRNVGTCIDHAYAANRSFSGFIIETDITDHYTIGLKIEKQKKLKNKNKTIRRPMHDPRSIDYLKQYLRCVNWSEVCEDKTVTAFEKFERILEEGMNICCPIETKDIKNKITIEPWYTDGLLTSRKTKEKLLKDHRKQKTDLTWNNLRTYRNVYNRTIRAAKKIYYDRQFKMAKNDSKKTWQIANELTGRKPKTEDIEEIQGNSDPNIKAKIFNEFFADIAPKLAKKIKPSRHHFTHYLPKKTNSVMTFDQVDHNILEKIIKSMMNKTSYSHDNISNKIIKEIRNEIIYPLTHLVNLSLAENYVPESWKRAKIVPIFKSNDKTDPTNYRPISLLPTLSKILEKVVSNQVHSYLSFNKILTKNQFGFRPKHNTEHLLLKIQDYVFKCREAGEPCLAVFIDLKKAFDTVQTTTLLAKLKHYGLPWKWFESYLGDRKQYVHIQGENSEDRGVECGVPQGSILGPLLFLLYINDLPQATKFLALLYADDTTFLLTHKDPQKLIIEANKALEEAEDWFLANHLTLHPGKTRYMIFHNKKLNNVTLKICNTEIKRIEDEGEESSFKLVGVNLDENLNWKRHITTIHNKILKVIVYINRTKHNLPNNIKTLLYKALVVPYLEYCIAIWGGSCKQSHHTTRKIAKENITNSYRITVQCPHRPIIH